MRPISLIIKYMIIFMFLATLFLVTSGNNLAKALLELLMLGRVPFTQFYISFDVVIVLSIVALALMTVIRLHQFARSILSKSAPDIDYLSQISI